jgi:6-phosphogluconolactonase
MRKQKGDIRIFTDNSGLEDFCAELFFSRAFSSAGANHVFHCALSGGTTPAGVYLRLSARKEVHLWEDIHIWQVDERFVPPGHRDSNWKMIEEKLVKKVPLPGENRHPFNTSEGMAPARSAREYEREIREVLYLDNAREARFDLIFLGIGEDGHTASIFPENPGLINTASPVFNTPGNRIRNPRLSLSLELINRAREVVFIVTGSNKARIVEKVINESTPLLPASLVEPAEGRVFFALDSDAAVYLD